MGVPLTAWVANPEPTRRSGFESPAHFQHERVQALPVGDPSNARNIVHDGDFFSVGKPFAYPGVHKNIYTAIPQQQSRMERFFGFVIPKPEWHKATSMPRGRMEPMGGDVNVEVPQPMTYGDFATYAGFSRQQILSTLRGV